MMREHMKEQMQWHRKQLIADKAEGHLERKAMTDKVEDCSKRRKMESLGPE